MLSVFYLFRCPFNIFFCFLADLTKAMDTPIPGERPAPADLDLARVGLRAPLKSPQHLGAGPSERAPLAMEVCFA